MQRVTIQDFPWNSSLESIKASEAFHSYREYYQHLEDSLRQNSQITREKNAQQIQRRFFPEHSLDSLLPRVWRTYHDADLLVALMRVAALEAEPVIADFLLTHVLSEQPGQIIERAVVEDYIVRTYGEYKAKSTQRLLTILRQMGFLRRSLQGDIIEHLLMDPNALLVLLHDRLAPTPRIVRLSEIESAPWRRYLGFHTIDDIRETLRHAEQANLLARFARVDELEQVTTRYSRDEWFSEAMRLC